MNIGDDVTINGTIIAVCNNGLALIECKNGIYSIDPEDINTIRPKIEIPEKDERRGN